MIRNIKESDFLEVNELLFELDSSSTANEYDEQTKIYIKGINDLEHMRLIGYELDGKIVGMCTLGKIEGISKNGRPFSVIENVVVHRKHQNKGIGKKLVSYAIGVAEQWSCYKIILETGSKQNWKHQFYEKCGLTKGVKTAFIKVF